MLLFYVLYFIAISVLAFIELKYNEKYKDKQEMNRRILLGWLVLLVLGLLLLVLSYIG